MFWVTIFAAIGIFSRLLPHVPNFSPLVAVALFSGVYFDKKHGYLIPLAMYMVSDLIIGIHSTVIFTWPSIILIYFLGRFLKNKKTFVNTVIFTFLSAFLFFIITNFGVWFMGWYPHNMGGLVKCYIFAIPFFRVSLLADFIYVGALFGVYEYFFLRKKLAQRAFSIY